MSGSEKRVTIVDVAERANVSIGTVSRVLNSDGGAPETRRRVRDAVTALNYVPNHVARSLKLQSTEQIALVVPDIANPVYVAMAKGVQQEAKSRGYRMSLISTEEAPGDEEYALQSLGEKRVDGLIICSLAPTTALLRLMERVRERVCVIGNIPNDANIDGVRVDSAAGAAKAVQHLLDQGRQKVGFINGTEETVPAASRLRGYQDALSNNNLPLDHGLIVRTAFTVAGGYSAVDSLLASRPDVNAIFCANDMIALGALRRLGELGIDVPSDMPLVGMDDIGLSRISTPSLTSVTLLAEQRGQMAADILLTRVVSGSSGETRTITVMPRLIVRESSSDYIRGHTQRT